MDATHANQKAERERPTGSDVGTAGLTSLQIERLSNEELLRLGFAQMMGGERMASPPVMPPPAPIPWPPEPLPAPYEPAYARVPGTLYAVRALPSTPVKIGFTRAQRLEYRLSGLQTGNPYPIKVVAKTRCLPADELHAHKALAADRLTGEWFNWTPRVEAFVKTLRYGVSAALDAASAHQAQRKATP